MDSWECSGNSSSAWVFGRHCGQGREASPVEGIRLGKMTGLEVGCEEVLQDLRALLRNSANFSSVPQMTLEHMPYGRSHATS